MASTLVTTHTRGPEVLQLAELRRRSLARSKLRVTVEAAGVNPVDAGNEADPAWAGVAPPYVVGHEFAASTENLGALVHDLHVGEAVWGLVHRGCRPQHDPPRRARGPARDVPGRSGHSPEAGQLRPMLAELLRPRKHRVPTLKSKKGSWQGKPVVALEEP